MAEYKFYKKNDNYYIQNEDITSFIFTVSKLKNCVNFEEISKVEIQPGKILKISLERDGIYTVLIDGTDSILIKDYTYLQLSIIEGIYNTLCDCECGCDCGESTKEKELCNLLMLRTKLDAYKRLIFPVASAFNDIINSYTKKLIEKPIYCVVDKETIIGEVDCNIKLTKQLIALDYLAIYFSELKQIEGADEILYTSNKFKINDIFCCVQSLGIDVGEIQDLIDNNMGTLTINNGAYVNLPPTSVGDNTISVGNRAVTILTLTMFTTNTTPAYSDPEGDAAKEVRINTLPVDGVLKLSGIPVTAGQVIPVASINANNLIYESPDQDALDSDNIDFSISDVGSGLFTT